MFGGISIPCCEKELKWHRQPERQQPKEQGKLLLLRAALICFLPQHKDSLSKQSLKVSLHSFFCRLAKIKDF